MRSLFLTFIISLPCLSHGLSVRCEDGDKLDSVLSLEKAYNEASSVFLANAVIEHIDEAPGIRWKYEVILPVLKGKVELQGYLVPASNYCDHIDVAENGVYLVFWKNNYDPISQENAVLTVYGGNKVIEEWAVQWAAGKAHNKAQQSPSTKR